MDPPPFSGPIVIPITDVIDLHTFHPGDVKDLLDDYFTACVEKGIFTVRVVHGKGTGALKKRVQGILARHPRVIGYSTASPAEGGWGATWVTLERTDPP